jgi:para-nitrobenzyl esterase
MDVLLSSGEPVTVPLSSGAVRGRGLEGHLSFRGIPYAAPPVGERRWRAPAPVVPWSGVRDATAPGTPAPQLARSFADVTALDEDCLTLDVTVPAAPGTGRPVLVWLHGGGGTNGSTAGHDPRRLAITGDVVVVAPHSRLGVLACFGYPGLANGGTFGLQDQQAALRWVQREITRFGGDPANVTLAGESYGASMVAAHLASPASAGLFHRAVLQSAFAVTGGGTPAHTLFPGVPALPPRWVPADELARIGAATAAERGWVAPGSDPASALAQLRRVPVAELLAASDSFIRPAFGGATLPESPADALPAGRFHRVPLLLGATRDEARFFVGLFADLTGNPVTAESYPRLLREAFGVAADEVAARYPLDRFPAPSLAWAQVCTDRAWARPAWELAGAVAAHTRTWFAEFADPDAPAPVPLPGLPTGALHGSELAYQFDVPGAPVLSPAQRDLAEVMNRYWTTFAAAGDPAVAGLPAWPTVDTGHVQSLAPGRIGPTDYVAAHALDFWTRMP